jgi:DNA-binding CsgD family transcriptional regulator
MQELLSTSRLVVPGIEISAQVRQFAPIRKMKGRSVMMSSISPVAPDQPANTTASAPAASSQAAPSTPTADTVVLSQPAQVSQLFAEGESPSEIAGSLGISIADVDSDLGILAAQVSSTPAAAPTTPAPAAAAPTGTTPKS